MGCTGKQKSEDFIRPVKVGYALREQGANCEILSGEVSAGMEMNVTFRSPGTLQSVYVKPGSFIKQGTLIASLDAREYELAYDAAKSKYDQVSGEVDRVKELYARNSVAKNDYDKAIAGLETVKALYETAKYQLEDTKLYAPINGYVQSVKVSVGQTITPLTPIINMVETQTLSISTNIPSSLYLRRDSFEHFTATSPLLAGSFPLELQYIAPKANNSQLYRMGLSIVGSVKDLAPGMIVEVRIDYKMPDSDELRYFLWLIPHLEHCFTHFARIFLS